MPCVTLCPPGHRGSFGNGCEGLDSARIILDIEHWKIGVNLVSPRSLLVVSQSLDGGGAERAIAVLLNHLDRKQFQPSLALFTRRGAFLDEIPPDVPVYDVGESSPYNVVGTAIRLRRTILSLSPSIVLSFLKHPNLVSLAVCRAFFPDIPVVISERDTLSLTLAMDRGHLLKRLLHRRLYPYARKIIAVSNGVKDDLEQSFGISSSRIQVIYNPCNIERVRLLAAAEPDLDIDWRVPTVVAAGRLTAQKGFMYLLQAFAAVARQRSSQLLILGDGEERPALTRLAGELGIADRVLMPGFPKNPFAYMARGSVFVLPSVREGFPNVLVEAMACGTPVISTTCRSGPNEVITHGVNGLLVPPVDPISLAEAMNRLLGDDGLRARLSDAGRTRAIDFAPATIVPLYEDILAQAIGTPSSAIRA